MSHPNDNSGVLTVVDEIREFEQAKSAQTIENMTQAYEALDAQHTVLKTEYAEHLKLPAPAGHTTTPPIEPQPTLQVYGTSYGGADESRNKGRSDVARIFWQSVLPSNWRDDADVKQALADGNESLVLSWKGSQTGSQLKTAIGTLPKDVTVYGCYWHEPEDNIAKGTLTLAAWRARHIEHQKAMREVGVIPVGIFMAYSLTAGSGRDITDYFCGDDGVMFDAYFNPAKGKTNTAAVVDRCVAAAKAAGAKFGGLGETGVPDPVDDAVTIQLTKSLRAKLDATPYMRVNCYWPSGDFKFISDAHADAWFTDPTPAPLVASRNG